MWTLYFCRWSVTQLFTAYVSMVEVMQSRVRCTEINSWCWRNCTDASYLVLCFQCTLHSYLATWKSAPRFMSSGISSYRRPTEIVPLYYMLPYRQKWPLVISGMPSLIWSDWRLVISGCCHRLSYSDLRLFSAIQIISCSWFGFRFEAFLFVYAFYYWW